MCEQANPFVDQLIERLAAEHSQRVPRVRRYCESSIMKMQEAGMSEEEIYREMSERVKALPPAGV